MFYESIPHFLIYLPKWTVFITFCPFEPTGLGEIVRPLTFLMQYFVFTGCMY